MPIILPLVFNLTCSNTYSNHTEACNKALEASAKQSGFYDGEEKTENYIVDNAKNDSDNYLGKPVTYAVVGTGYIYKTYRSRNLNFRIPNMGICDNISNQITPNSYTINFKWNIW